MARSIQAKLADRITRVWYNVPIRLPEDFLFVKWFKKVLTDEECELCMYLEKIPKPVEEIAKLSGKDEKYVEETLWSVAEKGCIFCEWAGEKKFYRLEKWAPGIDEFMMGKYMDKETAALFGEMLPMVGPVVSWFNPDDGGMRVIPVMKEIAASTHATSYDQVLEYVNKTDMYSAADCVCRTSKKLLGEGCMHPIENMCIQLGDYAEFYIKTGRGRQLTREEVIETLKKAEETGCVHEIFNPGLDGSEIGSSTFICNCCSCSCGLLSTNKKYGGNAGTKSNYIAKVNPENCVACGACVNICPMNAVRLGDALVASADSQVETYDTPYDTWWGKDKWDDNYRDRIVTTNAGTAPCKTYCPAHIAVQGYIRKAKEGKYREALELIKRENPFPAVCGRICPHPCESQCTRGTIDEPVAIDAIKQFIAEKDLEKEHRYIPEVRNYYNKIREFKGDDWKYQDNIITNKKTAVIGGGPAGLSCAYYLAVEGFEVTVFEKDDVMGGMLTKGIPSFRLDNDIINAEINIIKTLGVEFRTGVEVGKDVTIQQLRDEGYSAFYVAIGAQQGSLPGIEGQDAEGVITGVDFLRKINLDQNMTLSGKTVVIGGGNVAIDVARFAIRAKSESVDLFCLESAEEMPALAEEQEEAIGEGITINNGWGPKRILVENGKAVGVEFIRCVSVFDENHRFNPKYDETDVKTVMADNILMSIGQKIVPADLFKGENVEMDGRNRIIVDQVSYQTSVSDIFAGGDVVTGPKFAIDAIAMGKQGFESILRYHRQIDLKFSRQQNYYEIDRQKLDEAGFDHAPRQKPILVDPMTAKYSFKDLREGLTEEQVRKESDRCLSCGRAFVDPEKCIGCGDCTVQCKFDAIHLEFERERKINEGGLKWIGSTAGYAAARAGRIVRKSATQKIKDLQKR